MSDVPPTGADAARQQDIQALAKGGQTNVLGFVLRLIARIPFMFIAGRLYGAEAVGRFALALVVVELSAQLCTLGQKRGLAQRLSEEAEHPANAVADAMVLGGMLAAAASLVIYLFPDVMFSPGYTPIDRFVVLTIIPATLTEIALAALAYRYDIATSVRARAVVEPWTLSLMSGIFFLILPSSGLLLAYDFSILASAAVALHALVKSYGLPQAWKPHPLRIAEIARANMPLAVADAVEWGTRRFDIYLLGFFANDDTVGIYYMAQQFASLPQKLKTSFEPVLGPVITRNLKDRNYAVIARQVCQVGFWITASQAGIALAMGMTGEGWMGLVGPGFVVGTAALAFLLLGEVLAAPAVVSEAVLIYVAPIRNMWLSLGTLVLQAGVTVGLIWLVQIQFLPEAYAAAMAGAGLMVALGLTSVIKGKVLAGYLGHPVSNWRWALLWALIPASMLGWLVRMFFPEWAALIIGAPAILLVYGAVIWHFGFGPEDRVLFRKNVSG